MGLMCIEGTGEIGCWWQVGPTLVGGRHAAPKAISSERNALPRLTYIHAGSIRTNSNIVSGVVDDDDDRHRH